MSHSRLPLRAPAGPAVVCALLGSACQGVLGLGSPTVIEQDGGAPATFFPTSDAGDAGPSDSDAGDASPSDSDAGDATLSDASPSPPDADTGAPSPGDGGDADRSPAEAAAPPGEAGGPEEGGGPVIDEPSAPCSQQGAPIFCADFDEVAGVGDGWTFDYDSADAGGIAFDSVDFTSPPRSAKVMAPIAFASVQLGEQVGALSRSVLLAFDLRLDLASFDGLAQIGIGQIIVGKTAPRTLNYVIDSTAGAYLQDYVGSSTTPVIVDAPLPPLRAWTRIVMAYDVVNGATLYEDGRLIASDPSAAGGTLDAPELIVGAAYVVPPGTQPFTCEVDNVVIRGQ